MDEKRRYSVEGARLAQWRLEMVQMAMWGEIQLLCSGWQVKKVKILESLWMKNRWGAAQQSSCCQFSAPGPKWWALTLTCVSPSSRWFIHQVGNRQLLWVVGGGSPWQPALMDLKFYSGAFLFLGGWETSCGMWVVIFLVFNYLQSKRTQPLKCPFAVRQLQTVLQCAWGRCSFIWMWTA